MFKSWDFLKIKKTNHKKEDLRKFLLASGKHKCCEIKMTLFLSDPRCSELSS